VVPPVRHNGAMRPRRLARALPAGLLAISVLAACGDETADDTSAEPAPGTTPTLTSRTLGGDPLDDIEAGDALLQAANVPGFESLGPSNSTAPVESDGKEGCETEDSFEDRFDRARIATTRVDTAYIYGDEARLLIVTSLVTSFADDEQAEAAYDAVVADFSSCTHYEDVDENGDTTTIDVESDTETASDDVDDQVNMLGTGTLSSASLESVDLGFGLSLARVENNATMTQVISIGVSDDRLLLEPYTGIAVDRLLAVMDGETPEDEAGPTPVVPPGSRLPFEPNESAFEQFVRMAPRYALPD
jgi:hypothetical protein